MEFMSRASHMKHPRTGRRTTKTTTAWLGNLRLMIQ